MTDTRMTFRLSRTGLPDGQIGLHQLAALAGALQNLATRIGRDAIEQRGTGRTYAVAEEVTRLRLADLIEGSTALVVEYGQTGVLDVDDGLEAETLERFEEVIAGLGTASRPEWTLDAVAEVAGQVLEALARCAPSVEFTSTTGRMTSIDTRHADRSVWRRTVSESPEPQTAVGHLYAVNLDAHRFRIRDDVGNAIVLKHVHSDHEAARMIDQRVSATGTPERGEKGELLALASPTVAPSPVPAEWMPGHDIDWSDELAKPGPDPDGGIDLTDDEWNAFMDAVKGR